MDSIVAVAVLVDPAAVGRQGRRHAAAGDLPGAARAEAVADDVGGDRREAGWAFATAARKTSAAERVKPWPNTATGPAAGRRRACGQDGDEGQPLGAAPAAGRRPSVGVCADETSGLQPGRREVGAEDVGCRRRRRRDGVGSGTGSVAGRGPVPRRPCRRGGEDALSTFSPAGGAGRRRPRRCSICRACRAGRSVALIVVKRAWPALLAGPPCTRSR